MVSGSLCPTSFIKAEFNVSCGAAAMYRSITVLKERVGFKSDHERSTEGLGGSWERLGVEGAEMMAKGQ